MIDDKQNLHAMKFYWEVWAQLEYVGQFWLQVKDLKLHVLWLPDETHTYHTDLNLYELANTSARQKHSVRVAIKLSSAHAQSVKAHIAEMNQPDVEIGHVHPITDPSSKLYQPLGGHTPDADAFPNTLSGSTARGRLGGSGGDESSPQQEKGQG